MIKEKEVYKRYLLLSWLGVLVLTNILIIDLSNLPFGTKFFYYLNESVLYSGLGLISFTFILLKIRRFKKR